MRKLYWIILAIFTYLVFLIAYMPAIYVTNFIEDSTKSDSQTNLRFEGVKGTLFEGSANAVTYNGNRVSQLKWDTSACDFFNSF